MLRPQREPFKPPGSTSRMLRDTQHTSSTNASENPSVLALRKIWPILLCVYLFNAFFVDMAYQFVIGLLFTVAGILQASQESAA